MLSHLDFKAKPSFALLLQGPPLSGKTNVAMQFPRPYFLDADDKLLNAVMLNKGKEFYYDCPLRHVLNGVTTGVFPERRWQYSIDCIKAACASPDIDTVVIDSITSLGTILMQHILQFPSTAKVALTVGGEKVMDMSMWGPYRDLWTRLIMFVRGSGKMAVFCAHEVTDKDEITGAMSYRPSFQGQLKDTGAGLFTDVWCTETKQIMQDGKPATEYLIRTQPTSMRALGNSLKLPATFKFDWQTIKTAIDSLTAV